MNILVLGAGAWGTALAVSASANSRQAHQVTLWARDAAQARAMRADHVNARYLPGLRLPKDLRVVDGVDVASFCAGQDLVILGAPMAGLRGLLQELGDCRVPVAWICKGLERSRIDAGETESAQSVGLMAHEVQAEVAPQLQSGVLSGPSFAQEVALGQPTALVAASAHALVRERLVQAFHSPRLRVYENDDLVGVEVGGAVKNILAIATGLCDGLNLGLNARAALITRGLAEMMRFGLALGARAETFMGLSGLGDLVLTATGDLSRNRKVGLLLAQGKTLDEAVTSLGHVAEGVYCARTVAQRARHLGVDMPITEAVVALLDGEMQPQQAVQALMEREPSSEIR
ncbi:NAD(P)H-dependent glycerol-3-phosphate dehydrogenase [Hylemonella sp. W303a]|uniref:NAD(P)H-dependent glycerol-3-phosphate dehydrogenase n=1 Tax=Hylemonella sp. W303a TaxID=3389873 RepID=UPI00396B40E1